MAKGHRSQIKRERNANKDTRPSAKLSYAPSIIIPVSLPAITGCSVLYSQLLCLSVRLRIFFSLTG